MGEPRIINPNPEKYFKALLSPLIINGKHPITSSSAAGLDDDKHLKLATDDEKPLLVLKFAGLIILCCRKSIVSNNSNLDGPTTLCWGGSEWYGGSLIPDPLPPVGKGGGYRQRGKGKQRSGDKGNKLSGKGSKNNTRNTKDDVGTNKDAGSTHNNNNNNNKNNNNNNKKDEGGSEEIGITDGDIKGLRLHLYRLKINDKDKPMYNVSKPGVAKPSADVFRNWGTIALALHGLALGIKTREFDKFDIWKINDPYHCWPGCITFFGRAEADHFYHFDWLLHDWDHVKFLVTDIVIVQIPLSRIL